MERTTQGEPGTSRSNINDVAELAGVSRQTVSNVLNNRAGYYSAETRERVERAMATLGYRPNRAARSLRSRRSRQLGYHMPGEQLVEENAFVLRFMQALVRAAAREGHHVLVFGDHDAEQDAFRELIAMNSVDGFVLSGSRFDDPRARLLMRASIPFAMFGRTAPDLPQSWVDIDNAAAVAGAVDHLVTRGGTRFAYVGYDSPGHWDAERVEGYRTATAAHGLPTDERSIVLGHTLESVHEPVRRLLTGSPRPDAVVTGSDVLAAAVVNTAQSLGLRPGRDVRVVGFDGGFVQQMTDPVLTSVRIPLEAVAAALVERCLREIDRGPTGEPGLMLPTEIDAGGTA